MLSTGHHPSRPRSACFERASGCCLYASRSRIVAAAAVVDDSSVGQHDCRVRLLEARRFAGSGLLRAGVALGGDPAHPRKSGSESSLKVSVGAETSDNHLHAPHDTPFSTSTPAAVAPSSRACQGRGGRWQRGRRCADGARDGSLPADAKKRQIGRPRCRRIIILYCRNGRGTMPHRVRCPSQNQEAPVQGFHAFRRFSRQAAAAEARRPDISRPCCCWSWCRRAGSRLIIHRPLHTCRACSALLFVLDCSIVLLSLSLAIHARLWGDASIPPFSTLRAPRRCKSRRSRDSPRRGASPGSPSIPTAASVSLVTCLPRPSIVLRSA